MKKTIKMNERELHRIINESIKRVLNEEEFRLQHNHSMINEILHVSGLNDALNKLKHYREDNPDSIYGEVCADIYYGIRYKLEEIAKECNHWKYDNDVHTERVKAYNDYLDKHPNWKKQFTNGEEMANNSMTISHLNFR